ncbi:MAG: cell division FtsZ family protein [Lentisphaerae bacterium]|nr:cell division FtsZ family protein [Lentisphaerota bacterium]
MDEKKICVLGVGGAGCRVVAALAGRAGKGKGPSLAAVSTDRRTLEAVALAHKVRIGQALTRGLGAGGDVALGRRAAEADGELIRGLVEGMELVLVVAGLGGGTGTGAAPVILDAAQAAGAMTLGFVTLPFPFEGEQRTAAAAAGVDALRSRTDTLVVVPNERLVDSVRKTRVDQAFTKADQALGIGLRGIWKLLTQPGYLNLDFADLRRVTAGGTCGFAYGEGKGRDRAKEALESLLKNPLVDGGRILGAARSLVVSLSGGADLALREVGEVMQGIARAAPGGEVVMGTIVEPVAHDKLTIVVLPVSGPRERTAAPAPGARAAEAPGAGQDAAVREPGARALKKSGGRRRPEQTKLGFQTTKGRFKGIEPTIHAGEDIDIPTFIRRGITIDK